MRRDWKNLALHVRSRRLQLGMRSQDALAEASQTGKRTINELERGRKVSDNTLALVEHALAWKPGSVESVLHGGEPTEIDAPAEPARRYSDPQEQALWELEALPEETRLELIAYLRARRGLETG